MTNWWELDKLGHIRMQEQLREAERRRLIRQARSAGACHTDSPSLIVAWLSRHFPAPTRRRQERCCTSAGLGQSQSESRGALIL
jgi:hypothetical protein